MRPWSNYRVHKIIVVTGPPAAGKTTLARYWARLSSRCAVVDIDALRWMTIGAYRPGRAPWETHHPRLQYRIAVESGCSLARTLRRRGFSVLITDSTHPQFARLYLHLLRSSLSAVVAIVPPLPVILRRNRQRDNDLNGTRVKQLHDDYANVREIASIVIDNTGIKPSALASRLQRKYPT